MKKILALIFIIISVSVFAGTEILNVDELKQATKEAITEASASTTGKTIYTVSTSQILTAGALSFTTSFTTDVQVLEVELVFSSAVTETVTITKIFADTNYNTIRKIESLVANTNFVFNDPIYIKLGQQLKLQCTNATATATVRATITYVK